MMNWEDVMRGESVTFGSNRTKTDITGNYSYFNREGRPQVFPILRPNESVYAVVDEDKKIHVFRFVDLVGMQEFYEMYRKIVGATHIHWHVGIDVTVIG